ncbi:MAG: hypothetical protein AAGI49_19595 [Bacteroidota bacterium]
MAHNKKIEHILRTDTDLPDHLSWERMRSGILERMEDQSKDRKGVLIGRIWTKGALIALLLLVLLLAIFLVVQKYQSKQIAAFPIPMSAEAHQQVTTESFQISSQQQKAMSPIADEKKQQSVQAIKTTKLVDQQAKTITTNTAPENTMRTVKIEASSPESVQSGFSQTDFTNKIVWSSEDQIQSAEQPPSSIDYMEVLEGRAVENVFSTAQNELARKQENLIQPHKRTGKFRLEVGGGINIWQSVYDENSSEGSQRSALETEQIGHHAMLRAKYYPHRNLYVETGLDWMQLNSRFYYETQQRKEIEARNALAGIHVNVLSGDTTFVYRDTVQNVYQKRKVQHHNQHQIFSIPLLLGYEYRKNRWQFGVGIGGQLAVHTSASGRTIDATGVITYNQENPIYKSSYGFGLTTKIQANYQLSPQFYVGGNVFCTAWLSDWERTAAIDMRARVLNFSLVLGKAF